MSDLEIRGILAAVVTPFTADGSAIDEDNLRAQVDRLVEAGIHALVPTGSTGEFASLSLDEHKRVIELYVEAAAGRVPVIAGIGGLTNQITIELAKHAKQVGADALMVVPPFYEPLGFEDVKFFLTSVSEAAGLPIVYYNIPGITGAKLSAAELAELGEIENVKYLKDTSGDAVSLTELLVNHSDKIKAFNGWDTLTFVGIASGAEAAVWGAAGIVPEQAVELWNVLAEKKDLDGGRELWAKLWRLADFLESVNYIAGVKAGLELVGSPAGPPRLPARPLSDEKRAELKEILDAIGVTAS
ncbi:dihydrodipicolinate synthase [Microlunatus phosphovorus NM-1]|uniref:Dihydrodipicolinate synthase n=1 Tax=Microlunatus phosphovorus (strain ATCC 700054 / DSM 10555 / JCM 9379 / NBRC 101784 / NCIMB 13414 / VKM Ac-1990 / NM-1) TaxID=1032480 RepID=F5XFL9_MICPN|nr:dihydrodipicolinate synthase family protein [Microlunatus phosphovorus]BAK35426.1 dihydrodipicolinate synthase [Microlunatus phosphovorus NM-1]